MLGLSTDRTNNERYIFRKLVIIIYSVVSIGTCVKHVMIHIVNPLFSNKLFDFKLNGCCYDKFVFHDNKKKCWFFIKIYVMGTH